MVRPPALSAAKVLADVYTQFTVAPLNGVVFASYRFLLKIQLDHADVKPSLSQVTLAGIGCGVLASYVSHEYSHHVQMCVVLH